MLTFFYIMYIIITKELSMKSFIAIIVTMFASQVFAADAPKVEAKKDAPKAEAKKVEAKKEAPKAEVKK